MQRGSLLDSVGALALQELKPFTALSAWTEDSAGLQLCVEETISSRRFEPKAGHPPQRMGSTWTARSMAPQVSKSLIALFSLGIFAAI